MTPKRAQTIVMSNQKGGCGKTTTAVNLAAGLARAGYSTCLVDIDSQCNASATLGIVPEELKQEGALTVADAFLAKKPASAIQIPFDERFDGKLTLVPGHRALDQVEAQLEVDLKKSRISEELSPFDEDDLREENRNRLKKSLSSIIHEHDFIVIDTPPRLGFELTSALIAADWYIIPVSPSLYDVDGLKRLTETIRKIKQRANPKIELLAVILGRFRQNTILHGEVREKLKLSFPDTFCDTVINESVRYGETTFRRQTIFELEASETQAEQFEQLTKEILSRAIKLEETPSEQPTIEEVTVPREEPVMKEAASNE